MHGIQTHSPQDGRRRRIHCAMTATQFGKLLMTLFLPEGFEPTTVESLGEPLSLFTTTEAIIDQYKFIIII